MDSLKDKVVIVTGASSGIGEGTAVMFATYGSKLVLSGRSEENLKRVKGRCIDEGLLEQNVEYFAGDLCNDDARKKLIELAIEKFNRLDVLVNNAGICHLVDLSVTTPILLNTTCYSSSEKIKGDLEEHDLAKKRHTCNLTVSGNIVNVSSQFSTMAVPQMYGVYCMTKAAVDMFTKCLAIELGPHGIRVNSVNPGSVISNLEKRGPTGLSDETYNYFLGLEKKRHPIGRGGVPEDIAWAIVFLACDKSSFISGERMYVDGASQHVTGSVENPE